jgi:hypothetical protein
VVDVICPTFRAAKSTLTPPRQARLVLRADGGADRAAVA